MQELDRCGRRRALHSSTAGLWGGGTTPLYAASKSALHGFAFSLQKDFGSERSSIVVCPGPSNSPMREAHAQDATLHQSPDTIAKILLDDVLSARDEREQKLFVIRKGKLDRIACEPVR
jgi:NAD(P)-dependent dehydrogenase (short-subunit alcohol dehydrogenase family)